MIRSAAIGGVLCLTMLAAASSGRTSEPGVSLRPAPLSAPRTIDAIVAGGRVIDGSGAAPRNSEVGIDDGRIVYVGPRPAGVTAEQMIDATGLTVVPGFIDPHTHSGSDALSDEPGRRLLANHLLQGVTTIVIGNDGGGDPDVGAVLTRLDRQPPGPNVAAFVGFGAVRRLILGEADRAPTADEQRRMEGLVGAAMCNGALGLSSGLYYAPQSFARTEEVIGLARAAARRDGIYETHLRDEGSSSIGLLAAIEEALTIAESAGLPLHIAHIKALGVDAQGMAPRVIARIARARTEGLRVTADQYPWEASSTRLASALVPRWAMDGGRAAMVARLRENGARLREGMAEQLRVRGGAGAVLLVDGRYRGQRLDAIASEWDVAALDAAIRLLIEEPGAGIVSFNMADADIEAFARQSWVVAGSDASGGHPRAYGSFARRWRLFVRERPVMTETEFVRRASATTADLSGLKGRGRLLAGHAADIVILDPAAYREHATYAAPELPAAGVRHLFVNGRLAVANGVPTGTFAGRFLAKPRQPDWNCPE
ncbi:N-acyl-D-amino-acid deacylase family protein [Sphingosinithalassobacter sp. LHW66-3]|uniref:N-acyl-D-amino-acid deacylase family protein n=1 Tax=Sphingosinithalassobacter sp. LHW66-3 TaxID=3424718 RepID=UPI003D6B5553